jgi:hypothetical protein
MAAVRGGDGGAEAAPALLPPVHSSGGSARAPVHPPAAALQGPAQTARRRPTWPIRGLSLACELLAITARRHRKSRVSHAMRPLPSGQPREAARACQPREVTRLSAGGGHPVQVGRGHAPRHPPAHAGRPLPPRRRHTGRRALASGPRRGFGFAAGRAARRRAGAGPRVTAARAAGAPVRPAGRRSE